MPDVMVLQCMINFIYSLNPLLVFNIGASDILTDLCTPFVTTASLPCSCDYPVTCSKYMIVGRKINTEETEYINRLSYQNVIEANYNYIYRDSELVYNIKDYNIPDNKFLIAVVGYRLEKEMNKDFIELIDKILNMKISDRLKEECAEPYIVIIGNFDNPDKLLSSVSEVNREKIKFIGQINDAGEFVSLCKLYINPDRSGGGRSSFESLHHGIPVVTLNKGDVYYTCGDSFAVEDWEKYYEIVNKYYIDLEFYNLQREKAFKRADELENLQMTLEEIIGKITTSSEKEDL